MVPSNGRPSARGASAHARRTGLRARNAPRKDGITMTDVRKGEWLQTFSGRRFWPMDPRPDEVAIEDIAHALAMACRFGGHTREFYSVADHSVLVSELVPAEQALAGLLHDAAEAYLCDLPRPIKRSMSFRTAWRDIEAGIEFAIVRAFGLSPTALHTDEIATADLRALATEARDLMGVGPNIGPGEAWGIETPLDTPIVPLSWELAEGAFLQRFKELA